MKFMFFTFGKNLFWEDVYNYQDWIIQHNVRSTHYRLLDPHNIRRDSGTFDQCKASLLKYIKAFELNKPYDDTIIILHGFGRTKDSVKHIKNKLKELQANVISINYASLRRGIAFHANMISQLLNNLETQGDIYIVNVGASCLITRKLLNNSANYRNYNIQRILDINPLNSGSDLAELLAQNGFFNFFLGPMLADISTPKASSIAHIPQEIEHGIIFIPSKFTTFFKKIFSRFESFPTRTPASEESYSNNLQKINVASLFPLKNSTLLEYCKSFIKTGSFSLSHESDE